MQLQASVPVSEGKTPPSRNTTSSGNRGPHTALGQTLRIWSWFPLFFTLLPFPRSIFLHTKPERINEMQVYEDRQSVTTNGAVFWDEMVARDMTIKRRTQFARHLLAN